MADSRTRAGNIHNKPGIFCSARSKEVLNTHNDDGSMSKGHKPTERVHNETGATKYSSTGL